MKESYNWKEEMDLRGKRYFMKQRIRDTVEGTICALLVIISLLGALAIF